MNNLLKMKRKHDKLIDDLLQSYKVDLNQDKDGSLKLSNINDITKDVIRRLLDHIHQSELEVKLGYKPNDQKSRLVSDNYRNGSYTKTVKSAQGNIELNIPRDRDGEYTPQMVPKYQNTIIGLESKIINLIQDGLSYSGIQDALKDMYGINIDPHAMTDIANKISTFLEEWRNRPIEDYYPVIFIDGIRNNVMVPAVDGISNKLLQERSTYVVVGLRKDLKKDVLGFYTSESESASFWRTVFYRLKSRGLKKVSVVCSDDLPGISNAILESQLDGVVIQKCVTHAARNTINRVPTKYKAEVAHDIKLIYNAPDLEQARKAKDDLMAKWGEKYPQAVNAWDRNFNELTTFFKFPYELKKFIYTTNPIENLNRSIRYVSKRRGVFQNEKSLDNFVYLGIRRHMKNWRRKIVNDDIIAKQLDELFPEFKDCKCKYEVAELGIPE